MWIPFEKAYNKPVKQIPFILLESEIDQLVFVFGSKTSVFPQLVKKTAARPREAWNLQWSHIDAKCDGKALAQEKNSNPTVRGLY